MDSVKLDDLGDEENIDDDDYMLGSENKQSWINDLQILKDQDKKSTTTNDYRNAVPIQKISSIKN